MDAELRDALRERDAQRDDPAAAMRAALLVARGGDRDGAAEAFQEVLRRDAHDAQARVELGRLGCDLFFVERNESGQEELESAVDGARLVSMADARGTPFFVAKEPVTWERYRDFLVRNPLVSREEVDTWLDLSHGPLRRTPLGGFRLVAELARSYVTDVSWRGACAYARWARGDLPSGAQWELFARHGILGLEALRPFSGEWTRDGTGRSPPERLEEMRPLRGGLGADRAVGWEHGQAFRAGFRYVRTSWFRA